jgi:tagaturonate reductase
MKLSKAYLKDYKQYPVKVLQFGEGNFLRAFVDWMIDKMNKEAGFEGSVAVVQPIPLEQVHKLMEQDGLYTLYLTELKDGQAASDHSIIQCVQNGINIYEEYEAYLKLAESPTLRFITSNTTEAGIVYDEKDRLEDRPQNSFPGKLTAFLYHRYKFFHGEKDKGLILLPCELIDRNGEKLREIVFKYAAQWNLEEGFITWLKEANIFCCTLVDRVVTGYPKARIDEIRQELDGVVRDESRRGVPRRFGNAVFCRVLRLEERRVDHAGACFDGGGGGYSRAPFSAVPVLPDFIVVHTSPSFQFFFSAAWYAA